MNFIRPRALIGCECSGAIRRRLRARGWDAWSCDLKPAEDGDPHHIQGDVLRYLDEGWDMGIFHPVCRYLTNSSNRWLYEDCEETTVEERWEAMKEGAEFYCRLRDAEQIPHRVAENPIMHKHARALIRPGYRQIVQPHHFGDPYFKATGFELINLPRLQATNRLKVPAAGTEEHKAWSLVHRAPPGPQRETERSRTFPGMADAMAQQWGDYVLHLLMGRPELDLPLWAALEEREMEACPR